MMATRGARESRAIEGRVRTAHHRRPNRSRATTSRDLAHSATDHKRHDPTSARSIYDRCSSQAFYRCAGRAQCATVPRVGCRSGQTSCSIKCVGRCAQLEGQGGGRNRHGPAAAHRSGGPTRCGGEWRELKAAARGSPRPRVASGESDSSGNQVDCVHLGEPPSTTAPMQRAAIGFRFDRIEIECEG